MDEDNFGLQIKQEDTETSGESSTIKIEPEFAHKIVTNLGRKPQDLFENGKTRAKRKTKRTRKQPTRLLLPKITGKPKLQLAEEENMKLEFLKDHFEVNAKASSVRPVVKISTQSADEARVELEQVDVKEILHHEQSDSSEELLSLSQLANRSKRKTRTSSATTVNQYPLQQIHTENSQVVQPSIKPQRRLRKRRKKSVPNLQARNFKANKQQFRNSDSDESDGLQDFLKEVEPKKPQYKARRKLQYTEEEQVELERKRLEKRTCTVCNTVFAFPGGLRNHFRSKHTLEKPYTCDICGEEFAIQSSYSLHKRRHLGIKPHLCNLCGKTFLRRMDMRIHMRRHVPPEDKIRDVRCSLCPNVYTSKLNLRKHVLSKHTDPDEWKHQCTICRKRCFSATALTHHIRQHNDDRKYKCVICGRGFFTKQSMNVHVRTHSASTAYNCELCPNGYRSNEALQKHLLKVHGIGEEKPVTAPSHFCPVCKESFRQRARLEQHLLLHETGEEEFPFECERCNKRYKARNYFTIHMLDKHNVFIDDSYFKTHFQAASPGNVKRNSIKDECSASDKSLDNPSEYSDPKDAIHK